MIVQAANICLNLLAGDESGTPVKLLQVKLGPSEILAALGIALPAAFAAVHLFGKERKPNGEAACFYAKSFGYVWKVKARNGELADWSVYCPDCRTKLADTNSCYFCSVCQRQYDHCYYGITRLAFKVERETKRLVRQEGDRSPDEIREIGIEPDHA